MSGFFTLGPISLAGVRRIAVVIFLCGFLTACLETPGSKAAKQLAAAPVPASGLGPLTGKVFGTGKELLIITLHGDVSGSKSAPADYMYQFASLLSRRHPEATVVGMLRPGYFDSEGRQSPGTNYERWDQYTAQNNKAVADTIRNLKAVLNPKRVVVLGHSGGAAQLANVIALHPGVVDGAVLIACPCDLVQWRINRRPMARSQSPIKYVDKVPKTTKVAAITGENDGNTTPLLARKYVEALQNLGIDATVEIVANAGHNDLTRKRTAIFAGLDRLIKP